MTATRTNPRITVDYSFGSTQQGYTLTAIYNRDGYTVRVRVERDSYEQQSHAVAEVLTPALTWTVLVTDPASRWHPGTPYSASSAPLAVTRVADALTDRAFKVLATVRREG